MSFDPKQHMSKIKGKDYLEVKWRIAWFRADFPITGQRVGRIDTVIVQTEPYHIVRCEVVVDERLIASGQGTSPPYGKGQSTWKSRELEKAETAAIGRALASAGYGTQFTADEFDEGDHLSDAPIAPNQSASEQARSESLKTDTVTMVQVLPHKKGEGVYLLAGGCVFFSRDFARQLGYEDDLIEAMASVGDVELTDPIVIAYENREKDGKAYREPLYVERNKTGAVYSTGNGNHDTGIVRPPRQ